eukprot:8760581-Lingulodinium_polyedra.AAC.1
MQTVAASHAAASGAGAPRWGPCRFCDCCARQFGRVLEGLIILSSLVSTKAVAMAKGASLEQKKGDTAAAGSAVEGNAVAAADAVAIAAAGTA